MLEHGSRLDTVTMRFGRRFTSLLDGAAPYIPRERATRVRDVMKRQVSSLETIIGGKIKLSSNDKHIETRDGRIIPLGLMSSGQQELLPLLLALREYLFRNLLDEDVSSDLLYIEEPEAHLFPESQGDLIKYIVSVRNYIKHRSKMFITTHSPYVLATLNNLILASQISDKSDIFKKEVEKLVPIDSWLPADDISAYAIIDGRCVSIKSDFGLIDGIYLDGVSSNIVDTFDKLLEIDSTIDYDVN